MASYNKDEEHGPGAGYAVSKETTFANNVDESERESNRGIKDIQKSDRTLLEERLPLDLAPKSNAEVLEASGESSPVEARAAEEFDPNNKDSIEKCDSDDEAQQPGTNQNNNDSPQKEEISFDKNVDSAAPEDEHPGASAPPDVAQKADPTLGLSEKGLPNAFQSYTGQPSENQSSFVYSVSRQASASDDRGYPVLDPKGGAIPKKPKDNGCKSAGRPKDDKRKSQGQEDGDKNKTNRSTSASQGGGPPSLAPATNNTAESVTTIPPSVLQSIQNMDDTSPTYVPELQKEFFMPAESAAQDRPAGQPGSSSFGETQSSDLYHQSTIPTSILDQQGVSTIFVPPHNPSGVPIISVSPFDLQSVSTIPPSPIKLPIWGPTISAAAPDTQGQSALSAQQAPTMVAAAPELPEAQLLAPSSPSPSEDTQGQSALSAQQAPTIVAADPGLPEAHVLVTSSPNSPEETRGQSALSAQRAPTIVAGATNNVAESDTAILPNVLGSDDASRVGETPPADSSSPERVKKNSGSKLAISPINSIITRTILLMGVMALALAILVPEFHNMLEHSVQHPPDDHQAQSRFNRNHSLRKTTYQAQGSSNQTLDSDTRYDSSPRTSHAAAAPPPQPPPQPPLTTRVPYSGWGQLRLLPGYKIDERIPNPPEHQTQRPFTDFRLGPNVRLAQPLGDTAGASNEAYDVDVDLQRQHSASATSPAVQVQRERRMSASQGLQDSSASADEDVHEHSAPSRAAYSRSIQGTSDIHLHPSCRNQQPSGRSDQERRQENVPSRQMWHHILITCNLVSEPGASSQGAQGQETCHRCRRNRANVIIFNCHHIVVCSSCVDRCLRCPRCGENIDFHFHLPDP